MNERKQKAPQRRTHLPWLCAHLRTRARGHPRTRPRPPQTSERTDERASERTLRSPCTTTHRTNQRAQSQLSSSHHTADVADVADVAAVVSPWLLATCRANERTVHLSYVARRLRGGCMTSFSPRPHGAMDYDATRTSPHLTSPHLTSPHLTHCTDTAGAMSTNSSCSGTHMPTLLTKADGVRVRACGGGWRWSAVPAVITAEMQRCAAVAAEPATVGRDK